MSYLSTGFTQLPDLICFQHNHLVKPLNHPTSANSIIICLDYEEPYFTPGIYEYNLESNESLLLHKYDATSKSVFHGQCIDPITNSLYFFGKNNMFCIFNLETNKMKHCENIFNICCPCCPQSAYIPSPINQVQILDDDEHYIFNTENKSMNKLKASACISGILNAKLLYIASRKQLMIFGSKMRKNIYSYDVNQTVSEWKLNKLKMPVSADFWEYDILLGFTNILFVFYFAGDGMSQIYLLDLLNNKWFKSKYHIPNCTVLFCAAARVIKNNDDAHILDFYDQKHYKVCLYDLLPTEVVTLHKKYYKGLIMGYLREKENNLSIPILPVVLKQLILNYFQLFSTNC